MSFHHAPVTKGLMLAVGGLSLVAALFDVKHYFHLQMVPHLSKHHQYWRLVAHQLAFVNSSELLVAELLLFNVAVNIERTFGSIKYASFVVVSLAVSTLLSFVSLLVLSRFGVNYIPAGPLSVIFSILYQHYRIVPWSYRFRIFGLSFTNKAFSYILALQLVISQPPGSIVSSVLGLLIGQFYRSDLTNLKSFRLPPSIQNFASRFLLPLIGSTKPPPRSNRVFPDLTARSQPEVVTTAASRATQPPSTTPEGQQQASVLNQWVHELTGRDSTRGAAAPGLRVPTDAEISQLSSMFPAARREDVVAALQRSENVERAVESLLESQT